MFFSFKFLHNINPARMLLLACSVAVFSVSSSVMAQHGSVDDGLHDSSTPSLSLRASLTSALDAVEVQGRSLFDRMALQEFYSAREQKPYWVTDGGVTNSAQILFEAIDISWSHGLNPYNYHFAALRDLWDLQSSNNLQERAALELLLSDAFLRYVRDMSGMRVSAAALGLNSVHWKARIDARQSLALLHSEDDMTRILKSVEPSGATYKKLRNKLFSVVDSREGEANKGQKILLDGILRPGNSHRSIPLFRARLGLPQPTRGQYSYDDDLAVAVMAFQRKSVLTPDAIIGAQTVEAMNRSSKDKIHQIIANMERFRWVDLRNDGRFVVVNVPSAMLWALDGGQVQLEMPVVVGKPGRETQLFVTEIEGVRFNPNWTIPLSIKHADILPKLREDVGYLANKGIELYQGYGDEVQTLDPYSIDWMNMTRMELNEIRMVQIPGVHNALGRYRVLMPNPHNIYLHDTNHRDYFVRKNRALSSGCVRMGAPGKMAEYIMSASDDWGQDRIESVLKTGEKTDVQIDAPIPVYILYYTAWIAESGQITLGNDIYKRDRKLIKLLRDIDGVYIPRQNI